MSHELFEALQLNSKERVVFSALVAREPQAASPIAKVCGLARNTTRGILDNLVQKGIVARSKRGGTQFYATEESANIIQILRERSENVAAEYEERIKVIEKHSAFLASTNRSGNRPRVLVYDGLSGLKKVYEDTLKSTSGLKSWGNFDANQSAIPGYFRTYYKRRATRGIKMKSIHPDTALTREHMRRNKGELREAVTVPDRFYWTPEIQVYDDKVNIVSWKERIALIIESTEIAAALSTIFDMCYEGVVALKVAKRKSKKDKS